MQPARAWAANILEEDGEEMCRLFATKDVDRFAHLRWSRGRTGSPIIDGALAFVDCVTEAEHDAGDHVIVVGRVVELGYASEGKPLLFYRGGYGHFES
jgi:flavin reductase (DIM6/NTAB) family NADH-FMN oxidoreductase RutF